MDPRHHLGELLLEFLDLYGNNFDYTKLAICLDPPKYIPKVGFYVRSLSQSFMKGRAQAGDDAGNVVAALSQEETAEMKFQKALADETRMAEVLESFHLWTPKGGVSGGGVAEGVRRSGGCLAEDKGAAGDSADPRPNMSHTQLKLAD
ncbi:hypothetical protein B0T24DRAFT_712104 [Lasiosphaeria ovina]|uniref:PAP-associated domain-containing protein n=1 Tax=Lasiosphaeria ovina TaxID=92902 RepID=A0AAE0MZ21_9PEZI|nr:hypothetical protein B0T24DRAFT_712104 [Lasiosphaeria ovina]